MNSVERYLMKVAAEQSADAPYKRPVESAVLGMHLSGLGALAGGAAGWGVGTHRTAPDFERWIGNGIRGGMVGGGLGLAAGSALAPLLVDKMRGQDVSGWDAAAGGIGGLAGLGGTVAAMQRGSRVSPLLTGSLAATAPAIGATLAYTLSKKIRQIRARQAEQASLSTEPAL